MYKIDAVVVTYNRKKLLVECIKAILNQNYSVNKIFIVDNNSTDGTYDYLLKNKILYDNKIEYIKLERNIGGAGGFYTGMKHAYLDNCDWIWIMDDDTIPVSDSLKALVESLKVIKEKSISYLASTVYGDENEYMNVPNIDNRSLNGLYPDWYKYLQSGIVKIREATFVSLLINSDSIKKCGLPVKDYFIWGDDTEYTLRITKFYGPAYYVGKSRVIHKRKVAKQLTILEEDDLNRLTFHYYMIRNNLINQSVYFGKTRMLMFLLRKQKESLKILISLKNKNKFKKFVIIHKGILAFIFKRYDKNAFNNRLNVDVNYID